MAISFEEVLKISATMKLQSRNLLHLYPDEMGCWKLEPLPFSMMFPLITFHDGKIPCGFNTPSFLVYLGFRPLIAIGIFARCQEAHFPTRLTLMESAKSHVKLKWSKSAYNDQAIGNTPLGNSVLGVMGLVENVIAEINGLWERGKQDPSVMERHVNAGNLTLLEFVQEVLVQRMTKLLVLDMVVDENIE